MTTMDTSFRDLADRPLLDAAKRLAADERRATTALLRALMEIDDRRLYLGEGCSSMFAYCTQVLHLSEGGAYNRIEAARAARRYPVILDLFEQSSVTLTAIRLLAPHLTADNHAAVLAAARYKAKQEIEEIVAALRPKPDAMTIVRLLPADRTDSAALPVFVPAAPKGEPVPSTSPGCEGRHEPSAAVAGPPAIAPLAPGRYRIQLTVSRETHDKLRRAQSLLRHAVPSGDAAEIVDRALTLLVEDLERRRFAATTRPRTPKPARQGSRHIPAAVRRTVWQRDGGRCAFVGPEGRCSENGFLEFHHIEPYAAGGTATVENVQLRCRAHNQYEVRIVFGADSFERDVPDTAQ